MSKTRFLVTIATTGSALVVFASLVSIFSLFNEINSFYDGIIQEMDDFKETANDAWKTIMDTKKKTEAEFQTMSKTRFLVTIATTGSALVVFASLVSIFSLFNEINSFYDGIIQEMDDFKVL
uniref:Col_cuticle_N domain-containing protein n=1 Tax=Ascaris lumbricoides TaxID=6252 RepID=A0A0M3IRH5_ASCLU